MKHGIYYAYWEQQWQADYLYYIKKAANLGFDILEIAATPLPEYSDQKLRELKNCAVANGITLTCGHGPKASQNLASSDPAVRAHAKAFYTDLLQRLEKLDIHLIGGGIYSYWPVDYNKPIDKQGDWARSIEGVTEVAETAKECGVQYCLEVLNRFEGYLLNTSVEAVKFVREVDHPNVKVMLDTFHMNIEEASFKDSIIKCGNLLGHVHVADNDRMYPGHGHIQFGEVLEALDKSGYKGYIAVECLSLPEPFEVATKALSYMRSL